MTHRIRSILAISVVAIVLAACGTAVGDTASPTQPAAPSQPVATPSADPSVEPSEKPSEEPSQAPEERDVAGTITVYPGIASGPGGTIQEALDNGSDGELPSLVNGVLFRDLDGTIYLATAVSDAAAPTFDAPMLEVLGYTNEGESWDMANAELLGLQEANGIVFNPNSQILGIVEVN